MQTWKEEKKGTKPFFCCTSHNRKEADIFCDSVGWEKGT